MFTNNSDWAASRQVAPTEASNFIQEQVQSIPFRPQIFTNVDASPFPLASRARVQSRKSQDPTSPSKLVVPSRCRCYWSILALPQSNAASASSTSSAWKSSKSDVLPILQPDIDALEIVYVDPTLQAHLGQRAAAFIPGQNFFDLVHPDDVQQARKDMGDLFGPAKTTFGSVIRYRLSHVDTMRTRLLQHGSKGAKAKGKPSTRRKNSSASSSEEDAFPAVGLVISYIGDGLALCFMHNAIDESPHDSDEQNKSEWSNWCGSSAGQFSPQQADLLWRQLSRIRSKPNRQSAPEHIFQILRPPRDGGDILFSWPPPRLFPPINTNSDEIGTRQAASAIGNSTLPRYDDGSYFADDFATLAQSLNPALFASSHATTTCTRRLRAQHTITTDGLVRTLESVVIDYGDLLIAIFSTVGQELIADAPSASELAGSLMTFPAFVPTHSQLQQSTDFLFGTKPATLEAQSQVALMSQSPTTLSPAFLQQTLSPRQTGFEFATGDAGAVQDGLVNYMNNLSHPAPVAATAFAGNGSLYPRSQEDGQSGDESSECTGEKGKFPGRRSFDESMLSPQKRLKTFGGQAPSAEDRRQSEISYPHRRAVTFNPDSLLASSAFSQQYQFMDGTAASGRYRNPSQGSFANSEYSQSLGTIISYDSMASSETMFSPRQSVKWGSISGDNAASGAHRDSLASSVGAAGLDAAAVAAAASAAAAIQTRRRSRQETWPLARIDDGIASALTSASTAAAAAGLPQPSSERTRSRSAVFLHTDADALASQINAQFVGTGDYTGSHLGLPSTSSPHDPSSVAATAAAVAAVAAVSGNGNRSETTDSLSLFSMGVAGNSLNPYAAVPSPTAPSFSFGASPDVRPTVDLPPVEPGSTTFTTGASGQQHSRSSVPSLLTESFDPSTGLPHSASYMTSYAPHCRALSAPGLILGNGMVYSSSSAQQYAGVPLYGDNMKQTQGGQKTCQSCGTTNSPEWRRGPTGHKTLCNACGLRYSRSVLRAKKRAEKRKTSEQSIRRAREVAAAATTAASASAAAAVAAAASSREDQAACEEVPTSAGSGHAEGLVGSSYFQFDGTTTKLAGPTAEPMVGVISSEGYTQAGPSDLGLGLQIYGSSSSSQSYESKAATAHASALGFEPPFLSSRATTAASGLSVASTATSQASSASSFFGVMPSSSDSSAGLYGSSTSSLASVHSTNGNDNNNSSSQNKNNSGPPNFFGTGTTTMSSSSDKVHHGLSVDISEGVAAAAAAAEMERTTTADWMPFSSFGHPGSEGYDVDITV
ncbi:hypothetical protein CF327_g6589 [Tilletia walkeri]|uniref:GATA-type domain-containing protein n=1 Tax=Tilletia walkeri TaxID=117179 RepID=A0A8X7T2S0_9BASI|nr:hypothetical protein CF327_g6589 [Tilletia walkeri]KAE8266023.1 hypothetical protein A4X09_0g6319 [Tilletia walkeri]